MNKIKQNALLLQSLKVKLIWWQQYFKRKPTPYVILWKSESEGKNKSLTNNLIIRFWWITDDGIF